MENNENIKASFKGLVPFIVFILLYLGTGIFLNIKGVELAFYQLPGPVAAFAGIIVAFIIFKGTIQEKFNTFLEGCGHPDIITMCIIYLLAGAFAVVSKAMGGVDSTVNLGITYIPPPLYSSWIIYNRSFYINSNWDISWFNSCTWTNSSWTWRKKWSSYGFDFSSCNGWSNVWR